MVDKFYFGFCGEYTGDCSAHVISLTHEENIVVVMGGITEVLGRSY